MESGARQRSTRDRPAKPPLGEDVIVDAALQILRREGLDAVTMRRVAAELDTGPASLYAYFSGRDELRGAMLERVASSIAYEKPDRQRWRDQIRELLLRMLHAFEEHPGLAAVAVGVPPATERVMLVVENLVALLRIGGVTDRDAAWACDILALIVTATAVENDTRRLAPEGDDMFVERMSSALGALSVERFPNITALLGDMTAGEGDDRFIFAVDVFIDGLVARAGRE